MSRAKAVWNLGTTILEAALNFLAKQKADHIEEENRWLKKSVDDADHRYADLREELRRVDLERDEAATELQHVREERDQALRQLAQLTAGA